MSAAVLTGCMGTLLPHEVNQKAALTSAANIQTVHETQITKRTEGSPTPVSITQSGTNNVAMVSVQPPKVEATINDSAGSTSRTDQQSSTSWISSIPWGVKLIALAIGIGLLFLVLRYAWTYIRTNSPAVAAAYDAGDAALATLIGHLESKRSTATDAPTQANLNDLLAVAQKERGKLNSG